MPRRITNTLLWGLQLACSLAFILASEAKLLSHPTELANFAGWGFPAGFCFMVGMVELVGALLLLPLPTAPFAALALGVIMVGAALTHTMYTQWQELYRPLFMLGLLLIVTVGRYPKRRKARMRMLINAY